MEARIPIIARTTNSSIKLNPRLGMTPVRSTVCVVLTFRFIDRLPSSKSLSHRAFNVIELCEASSFFLFWLFPKKPTQNIKI